MHHVRTCPLVLTEFNLLGPQKRVILYFTKPLFRQAYYKRHSDVPCMKVTSCNIMLDMEPSDYFRRYPVCLLSTSTCRTLKRKFILQYTHT